MKYITAITILFLSLSGFSQSLNTEGKTYAVVVGISDYQDEAIPDLRFADKDAEAFAAFLQSPAGGSLNEDHLKVLINEQATAAQFAITLDWLLEVVQEKDKVIIYFSGHGDVERKTLTQPGFLLCWDAPARVYMAGGTFGLAYLQEIISTLSIQTKAKVIMVADACRSGKLSGSKVSGAQLTSANLAKQYANEIKILSCQPDEYSIEGEQWGGGRGAFSYHLLDGLYGMADSDENLNVDLKEISRYLEDKVSEEVAPQSQNPMTVGSRTEKLTNVFPELLHQLKAGKKGQLQLFTSTASKGIEEEVLAQIAIGADSNIVEMYLAFKESLAQKNFLCDSTENCADVYYEKLSQEPALKKLHSSMRRNYAAALQDDAQQVMNTMLKTGLTEQILKAAKSKDIYKNYPTYLDRAAQLLGDKHYMYTILLARKHFFEAKIQSDKKERIANYRKALVLQPDMPQAMVGIIKSSEINQVDSAQYYFQKAISLVPSWVEPYVAMSYFFEKTDQADQAEKMLDLAGEIDSTSILIWFKKGSFYYSQKKYALAEKWLKKAADFQIGDICFPCLHHNLASAYNNTRKYEQAEKHFKIAIRLDSSFTRAYNSLGIVYKNTRRYEEAEKQYKIAIQLDSTYETPYSNLGQLLMETNRLEEAEKYLLKAIQLDSSYYGAYNNLGNVYKRTNRLEEAEECFKKAIRLDSSSWHPQYNLGILYNKMDRYEDAKEQFQKVLLVDSTNLNAYNGLANIHTETGEYEKAVHLYKKILKLDSNFTPAHLNLGIIYVELNRLQEAKDAYEEALSGNVPYLNPWAYKGLGEINEKQGDLKRAESNYKKAIEVNPSYFKAYFKLVKLYLKTGQLEETKLTLEKILELDPNANNAYVYLAKWSLKINQIEEAWDHLSIGLEKGYNDFEYLQSEPDFTELRRSPKWNELMKKYFPDQMKK